MLRSEAEGVLAAQRFRKAEACSQPLRPIHPHPAQLERLMRGELSRAEARAVVRHLLASCAECLSVTRRLWALGGGGR